MFLESKVIKRLEEEQYPNQVMIHHFCILCQSISHVNGYKSSLFPDFALKYFNLHKDKLISILDIIFLVDAFTKKRIHKMDIYKIIEKKINEKLKGLSVEICNHLLKSAQRKYENFSMTFLGLLASRLDKLYQYGENFQKLNGRKALQLINLMNLVKEHNRTVEFEIYENLIALIENESLKDKTNIEKNKAEQSQIN